MAPLAGNSVTPSSTNAGFVGGSYCRVRAQWIKGYSTNGPQNINFSHFITRILISKSIRTLTPFVIMDLKPSAYDIVKNGIRANDYIRLEIKKAENDIAYDANGSSKDGGKLEWAFKADVFPADFAFNFHRTKSNPDSGLEEQTYLRLFLYPIFLSNLLTPIETYVTDKYLKVDNKYIQNLIEKTTGLEFSELIIDKFKRPITVPPHYIFPKLKIVDIIRYMTQRYGFYNSQILFFTDFADVLKYGIDAYDKPSLYIRDISQIDDISFGLKFVNTSVNNKVKIENNFPWFYIFKQGLEVDKRPEHLLKMYMARDYHVYDRENLCRQMTLEYGVYKDDNIKSLKQPGRRGDSSNWPMFWRNVRDVITTNSHKSWMAPISYFTDLYEETSQLSVRPSFWMGWRYFNIGKLVTVHATDPIYVQDDLRLTGNYLIKDMSVAIERQTGGSHEWRLTSEFTLIKRVLRRQD